MNLGLENRVAMVAAASKGLGKACALSLAKEGCSVSICSRDPDALEGAGTEISEVGKVSVFQADVSSSADIERWHRETVRRFGKVDILVTNTGGPPVKRFLEIGDAEWSEAIDSIFMSAVRLARLAAPGMRERKWGRIILLTSIAAKEPIDELTVSSALRAGLSALTRTLSNQLGPDNITVNAILTGRVLTDRQNAMAEAHMRERGITREQFLSQAAAKIPVRRFGRPEEVGDTVAFLASEKAGYISGVSLEVAGGGVSSTF